MSRQRSVSLHETEDQGPWPSKFGPALDLALQQLLRNRPVKSALHLADTTDGIESLWITQTYREPLEVEPGFFDVDLFDTFLAGSGNFEFNDTVLACVIVGALAYSIIVLDNVRTEFAKLPQQARKYNTKIQEWGRVL